jgi:hypothetical protein
VSDATLWRYMQDKGFKRRLSEAREASINHANLQLHGAACDAVKFLRDLMNKDDAPLSPRVSAARTILEFSSRARVVDEMQAEVERLKELVGGDETEAGEWH